MLKLYVSVALFRERYFENIHVNSHVSYLCVLLPYVMSGAVVLITWYAECICVLLPEVDSQVAIVFDRVFISCGVATLR